jgi:iron complex outermembrane recepter protein
MVAPLSPPRGSRQRISGGWDTDALCRNGPVCLALAVAGLLAGGWPPCAAAQAADREADLAGMSLQQLTSLQVTSVAKAPQALSEAPAAIYVITHDAIVRSGATSLAEALRLAPNLDVTQVSASDYVVSARGFNGDPQAQNFSNKMLILIDGRSVYSPLFSGVYLDAEAVLLRDVERIEVISGPGAALWGANAVNGIINIITRSAHDTTGTYASAGAGNLTEQIEGQYGSEVGDSAAVRAYARAVKRGAMQLADGSSAHDDWYKTQAGFHADWSREKDSFLLEADTYRALENQDTPGAGDLLVSGVDMLGRWLHEFEHSQLQAQAYVDESERGSPFGGLSALLRTYDLSVQQNLELGAASQLVWGAGERVNQYAITNDPTGLSFVPPRRALTLGNLFAQETFAATADLKLIAGAKLEDDPFAGWQFQPDVRVAWTPKDEELLWAAASRAIRSPTPFETDVVERIGSLLALQGDRAFKPERVTAYELGYRGTPASTLSLSISGFYNVYDDLRTIESLSPPGFLPLTWGNLMRGETYGVEGWADWQVSDWWRLSPGFRTLTEHLHLEPGASGILGTAQAGDDPASELKLTSSMSLPAGVDLDTTLRHVGALPDPALPAYWEMSARIGWHLTSTLDLSVTGSNLLHARHLELPLPYGEYIDRSVFARVDWSLR